MSSLPTCKEHWFGYILLDVLQLATIDNDDKDIKSL